MNIYKKEELSEKEQKELEEKQIEITNMYSQKPEEDALEELEDSEGEGVENGDGNDEETSGSDTSGEPAWKSFPIDDATGYRIDPATGAKYDADTGDPIEGRVDALGSDIPTNPNIVEPQT